MDEDQAYEAMAGYSGPRYEIERTTKVIMDSIAYAKIIFSLILVYAGLSFIIQGEFGYRPFDVVPVLAL